MQRPILPFVYRQIFLVHPTHLVRTATCQRAQGFNHSPSFRFCNQFNPSLVTFPFHRELTSYSAIFAKLENKDMAGRKLPRKAKADPNQIKTDPIDTAENSAKNETTDNVPEPERKDDIVKQEDESQHVVETQKSNENKSTKRVAKKRTANQKKQLSEEEREAMLKKGKLIMEKLEEVYPKAPEGFLDHTNEFTLLIAVLLSAQALDSVVNQVTPDLFEVGGTPEAMKALGEDEIRNKIRRIGLAPRKAKNIFELCTKLCQEYDGKVPDTLEELEKLPGVGHKTASVVVMQAFNKPAFPVDTHIHRLACRWGCGDAKSVDRTEASLKEWFPESSKWGELHTRIILFGREHCPARNHDMDTCPICSFAATEEARACNIKTKFVAPQTHANPYSIREVILKHGGNDDDETYDPAAISKTKKPKRGKKPIAKKDREEAPASKDGRKRKSADDTTEQEKVESLPKKSKIEKNIPSKNVEEAIAAAPKKRGRARVKAESKKTNGEATKKDPTPTDDQNDQGVRKSSRLREKANRKRMEEIE